MGVSWVWEVGHRKYQYRTKILIVNEELGREVESRKWEVKDKYWDARARRGSCVDMADFVLYKGV
jgi:hypothetical protein